MKLTEERAKAIYKILVEKAGAPPTGLGDFLDSQLQALVLEYRFQGHLGFGGKFWNSDSRPRGQHLYVNCYPEDLTPDRGVLIAEINQCLEAIAQ
ncbi:hypothetical protein ACQ4M3_24270 [Leptolyngbya sp. AN03gr2]|uniref:hypothetical protein n=1 Tax=unclassified Leptolyngbya TaxID=2650499 RepID=UPI003D31AB87